MSLLIFSMSMSLDGFVADDSGDFAWAAPDGEELAFINELLRPVGTFLFGRRMYETMKVWETMETAEGSPDRDFAQIWHSAEKVVFSTTLQAATTNKTRIAHSFDAREIEALKRESVRDIEVAGPHLAATAFKLGLVDECHIFLCPVLVGSGKRALPQDQFIPLELLDQRRFSTGITYLRYRVAAVG